MGEVFIIKLLIVVTCAYSAYLARNGSNWCFLYLAFALGLIWTLP